MDDTEGTLRDDDWDSKYFALIHELALKNASRYEFQADQLLKKKVLRVETRDAVIEFNLTPLGCSFSTSNNDHSRSASSWLRMGWRKSSKRRALPRYFACAEATWLIDQVK